VRPATAIARASIYAAVICCREKGIMHPELFLLVQLEHRNRQRGFDKPAPRRDFASQALPRSAKPIRVADRLRDLAVGLQERVVCYWVSGQLSEAR
jgi:hypothetical protein